MNKNLNSNVSALILGGGLAGLSTAYHLPRKETILVEKEKWVGGTARSFKIGRFTFDFTGHLLHLHTPYTKKLITKLLNGNFFSCNRNAWIYSYNTYTRYPFQANTQGLPEAVVDDCLLGFLNRPQDESGKKQNVLNLNFAAWCLKLFGQGISRHFMIPYNEKLFQTKAHRMSVDWCGPFVPTPKLEEEVIKGALEDQSKGFGYNTKFLYPKKGGIQVLAQSLGKHLTGVRLETKVKYLDWKKKTAYLSNQEVIRYKSLVNSIPLLEFLKLLTPFPKEIKEAKSRLRFVSILCLNIGVNRAKISDKSWIYFPEAKFPFYRVGFPMNFTPHVVPKGCSSMYVEVPMKFCRGLTKRDILQKVKEGLLECGILKPHDKLPVVQFLPIKYAYVIYDQERAGALKRILSFLARHSIQSIGRYGAWKYSFMEEAILDGKKAAEKIMGR